jgi:iron complex outermembrane receptor protein/outer membrane receptor for ferrienterochelin and colicins
LGAFTQLALHRKRWPEVDLGLRVDAPRGYDAQVLPSVAAMYRLSPSITLRANGGTGYQLPDRSRNYGLVTEGVIAARQAAGTRPERSTGGTAEWTWKKPLGEHTFLFVDQTFFATHIAHPLAVSTTNGDAVLANADGTTLTRGIDNYVRVTHHHVELYLGYTYTLPQARAAGTTTLIAYTPEHRAAMTLSNEFGEHWRAGVEASWSAPQARPDGTDTRAQLFMAAMVGYHSGRWTVALNGENITDTRQTRWERVVNGSLARPVFAPLWAPIDGRVINLNVLYRFGAG